MSIVTDVTWEQLYQYWEYCMCNAPSILKSPIALNEVNFEYNIKGFIYDYDWITDAQLQYRKELIKNDVIQFLYFTQRSNKGTIHTLQMLAETKTDE